MNSSDRKRVNQNLCLFRRSNRFKNVLRWSVGETESHVNTKFEICKLLKKKGCDFLTEGIFLDGKRADVVDLLEGVAYEVTESESESSVNVKKDSYPLMVVVVPAGSDKAVLRDVLGI